MVDAIPEDVAALLEDGSVAAWLATANAERMPHAARVMGAKVERAAGVVWLFVPIDQSTRAIANLGDGSYAAVTFCRITDYRAVQVKGTVVSMRPCSEEERPWLVRYRERLAAACGKVGIPIEPVTRLAYWPSMAIELAVRELYSQTPGPNAGAKL